MQCIICGVRSANTGEHFAKASDIRSAFRKINQQEPLRLNTVSYRNKKVGSAKADILKYDRYFCSECNNNRTQSYDLAWEHLSKVLRLTLSSSIHIKKIRMDEIFLYNMKHQMRNVHLYFVKLFLCQIVKGEIPIDITVLVKPK